MCILTIALTRVSNYHLPPESIITPDDDDDNKIITFSRTRAWCARPTAHNAPEIIAVSADIGDGGGGADVSSAGHARLRGEESRMVIK